MRLSLLLLAMLAFAGCGESCSNTIRAEAVSPDGKYVATAFIRDCGPTDDLMPHVHLRPVGEKLARTGNVFIGNRSDKIRIEWVSATRLAICSDCEVLLHEANWRGITIEKRDWK